MRWCTEIMRPVFTGAELQTNLAVYAVHAFAVHLGEDVQSGRYRVLLVDRGHERMHYCDDNRKPKLLRDFGVVGGMCMLLCLGFVIPNSVHCSKM